MLLFFFFNEPATTGIYTDGHTLSPHHPLPIYPDPGPVQPWQALLDSGAVQRLRLSVADVNQAFAQAGRADAAARPETGNPADTFIDLYAALVSRSEEHTSELQSLMRNSYAGFCLKKKKKKQKKHPIMQR